MSRTQRPGGASGVLALVDAGEASVAGAKAAALARAAHAGLPVLPGFVLTPGAAAALADRRADDSLVAAVYAAWSELSRSGRRPVIVRSSSTVEDTAEHSMAGRFTTVADVRGWDAFVAAVAAVTASAAQAEAAGLPDPGAMAVLVQPYVVPDRGGVLFGLDPVSGRRDRLVVAATNGGVDALVSGAVDGVHLALDRRGRVLEGAADALGPGVPETLARLAHAAAGVFDGPQDIEWALLGDEVVLLQSRPVTATAAPVDPRAPVLGPGPLAETFPEPLHALERDLWVPPLRAALVEALRLAGAVPRRRLARSPVAVTVGGRIAVDLELLGADTHDGRTRGRRLLAWIDPRPALRRLAGAWRTGRLRAAFPALVRDLLLTVDARLAAVPRLAGLSDDALCTLLERARALLVSVHGHEILTARLLDPREPGTTAAGHALRVLADRGEATDDELVARHPVVLSLVPPSIAGPQPLPDVPRRLPDPAPLPASPGGLTGPVAREALRLRARWLHELTARAARELGRRLAARGVLALPEQVADVPLAQLRDVVAGPGLPACLEPFAPGAPLPARFRLAPDGTAVPVDRDSRPGSDTGGRGAGGGRATGTVRPADALPHAGSVLVVRTLDPALAPLLPGLAGLVAETGSVLAHLAILARELGVPVVVGVPDAVRRFPPGTRVALDGTTGEVAPVDVDDGGSRT